jgi:hypothetical protein
MKYIFIKRGSRDLGILGCGAGFMFWRLKISAGGENLQFDKIRFQM